MNTALLCEPNPSAIFDCIESEDLVIWSTQAKSFDTCVFLQIVLISLIRIRASCHKFIFSNDVNFIGIQVYTSCKTIVNKKT